MPLIYLDLERSFGGALDQAETRLAVYRKVIADSIRKKWSVAGVGDRCAD